MFMLSTVEQKRGGGGGARFIYIVEVRDRMLTLAASRLSMMALGGEEERGGH